MKSSSFFILVLVISMLFGCSKNKNNKLVIACSANMQFAIKEIAAAFTQEKGYECEVIISSSGKLTAQILEGAPYDIFVSADLKYPETLYKKDVTTQAPKVYAYGQLVLWTTSESLIPSIETLTDTQITHIALANPKTAPYGKAAVSVLQNADLYEKIAHKLVYGESIAQTNQFIVSGAADIGFTSQSVVLSPVAKNKGRWSAIDKDDYATIAQGVVILKKDTLREASLKFYDFLFSPKSKEILENFGYLVPSN